MPESLEAIAVKKSPKMPLWKFSTFFDFFFSKTPVDRVKIGIQILELIEEIMDLSWFSFDCINFENDKTKKALS